MSHSLKHDLLIISTTVQDNNGKNNRNDLTARIRMTQP